MKIITYGNISKQVWWYQMPFTCKHCGTEAKLEPGDHAEVLNSFTAEVICPLCCGAVKIVDRAMGGRTA